MQSCTQPLVNSTTGHYIGTGTHSTSFWSAFFTSVQQARALECAFIVPNSMSTHCHPYQKYTGSFRNKDPKSVFLKAVSSLVFNTANQETEEANMGNAAVFDSPLHCADPLVPATYS